MTTPDVVVVGGGVAGLAAAATMAARRVLLLEQAPRLGGRVRTLERSGVSIELGACFAYRPSLSPTGSQPPGSPIEERGPLGALVGGKLHFAASARQILAELPDADAVRLVPALFNQIHPGELGEYEPLRRADAVADLFPDHYQHGNGLLVEALRAGVSGEMRTGHEVLALAEDTDGVSVTAVVAGVATEIRARAAIVATPATRARTLVAPADPELRAFLSAVRYARYSVVAFELEHARIEPDFRFIVTPERHLSLVMHQASRDRRRHVLLCYYAEAACRRHADRLDDAALVASTRAELAALGLSGLDLSRAGSHVMRWELSGTILGAEQARLKRASFARATRRVFLAGDYLALPPGWGYGLDDAVASGRATAALVHSLLDREI